MKDLVNWLDENPFIEKKFISEHKEDIINKPNHYHKGGTDVLSFVDGKLDRERIAGFHQINVLKYVTRYKEKNGLEDLQKAMFYLKALIDLESKE
jgi:hypothetical protein